MERQTPEIYRRQNCLQKRQIDKKAICWLQKKMHISCSASCSEIEEKLWDLWNVDLHREALEYINTRLTSNVSERKAEGGTFAGGKEQREVKSKPWTPCLIPQVHMGNSYPFSVCFNFFIIFICFLPGAGEAV